MIKKIVNTCKSNIFRRCKNIYILNHRVNIINKMRAKTEIHLGISGEKIEIDPVITGKSAARFWNRQRAVSYHIDNIAWCEVTETKGSKTMFTLVYTPQSSTSDSFLSSKLLISFTTRKTFLNKFVNVNDTSREKISRLLIKRKKEINILQTIF